MSRYSILFLIFTFLISAGWAQNPSCNINLGGIIIDEEDKSPLFYATVYIIEAERGATTDSLGRFSIDGLCAGSYHIRIQHVGCEPKEFFLPLLKDTLLLLPMHHHETLLHGVTISGERIASNPGQSSSVLNNQTIRASSDEDLSGMLSMLTGLRTVQNGNNVGRPLIQGLGGNRLTLINNGASQAGQQWGSDHAPELDAGNASRIVVIRGTQGIAYNANSLGAIILIEDLPVPVDPHLHGDLTYGFRLNGLGHHVSSKVEQGYKSWAWRVNASGTILGTQQSPDYMLRNSGSKRASFSTRLERKWSERMDSHLYYSFYDMENGILRGALLDNLTDLQIAYTRPEPFFTDDVFTYSIEEPSQHVRHHLLRTKTRYLLKEGYLDLDYSFQADHRDEFDVRRSGRSVLPSLSLDLKSHQTSLVLKQGHHEHDGYKLGFQNRMNFNENDPSTGILPLIPDYQSFWNGLFFIHSLEGDVWSYSSGLRADIGRLNVQYISRDLPRRIQRETHNFLTGSASIGAEHTGKRVKTRIDMGLATRAPEVNELYSYGLHQGVASLEEGNPELNPEFSWKTVLGNELSLSEIWDLEFEAYAQVIQDYIYLRPTGMDVLTIRGAYPLFVYNQTNALLSGMELKLRQTWNAHFNSELAYSMIRGRDMDLQAYLINMPTDRFIGSIRYSSLKVRTVSRWSAGLSYTYTLKQTRTQDALELVSPPEGYGLLDLDLSYRVNNKLKGFTMSLSIDNFFNAKYRDYLDRLRYFSDALGRQVNLKLRYEF